MYTCEFETTLQVQPVHLFNYIFNVLYFSIFNHIFCGKHNALEHGVQESNTIDVHEVTVYSDFLEFIKDALGDIWYYDRFHILNILVGWLAL